MCHPPAQSIETNTEVYILVKGVTVQTWPPLSHAGYSHALHISHTIYSCRVTEPREVFIKSHQFMDGMAPRPHIYAH